MLTLYDAHRCPYCVRVRIVLAEKGLAWEQVEIDLDDRPAWLYEKNPLGRVPVLEEDGLVLPESAVIMAYLDERYPEPPLLPADAAERALARLLIERFDEGRGRPETWLANVDRVLERQPYLTGRDYGLADVAYFPHVVRAGADGFPALADWVERLRSRPAVAAA